VIDIGRDLGLLQQRWAAMGMLVAFLLLMAALDFPMISSAQRLARRLEISLRTAFLEKIPRLGDRYLTSRPISDMAERSHGIHHLREVPDMARRFVRAALEIIVTAAGLAWLDPRTAPLAILTALAGIGVPLLLQPQLIEREHRARVHAGALARFNLDALLGLTAIRAHGAERSVRREHESLLVEWACAARAAVAFAVAAEGAQILFGLLISGAMLADYLPRAGDGGGMLLYAYWTMNLPILGQQIAAVTRQYPMKRNLTLRLLEPLAALEEPEPPAPDGPEPRVRSAGARIVIEGVTVVASGHTLLRDIDLQLPAGSHVAVVGASGAGKSSLLGLLLGWHRPAQGCVLVDGAELLGRRQDDLRGDSAWVDPAVQLWNRTLLTNLRYGSPPSAPLPLAQVLEDADLLRVIENLAEGLQTSLGEGGGLLSGGEGQRVRLGRALFRAQARLVVLDEPFRGLDRPRRSELLGRVRRHFASATMLCVTHDVSETLRFERVLVIEDGHIAEDGAPADLAAQPGSRYRRMLDAEAELRNGLFAGERFRRIWLEGRTLREEGN
jgi:ATP-binding cassette subfamily B protein